MRQELVQRTLRSSRSPVKTLNFTSGLSRPPETPRTRQNLHATRFLSVRHAWNTERAHWIHFPSFLEDGLRLAVFDDSLSWAASDDSL